MAGRTRGNYARGEAEAAVLRAQADTAALLGEVGAELVDVHTAGDPLAVLSGFFRTRRSTPR
ncbi:hypothetical protein D3C83_86400 [compost metagenome]